MWWVLVLFGILFVAVTPLSIRKGKKSESWPQIEGRVVASEVEVRQETDSEGDTSTYYYPRIHYSYRVSGTDYQSSKYRLLDASTSKKKAMEMVDAYPPGRTVSVFYNPENPAEAVLMTGVSKFLYAFAVIGGMLIIAGIVVFIS